MIRRMILSLIAVALLLTSIARAEPAAAPAETGLIRLHVLAEDNSRSAQQLKLRVRDAVLNAAALILKDCDSPDDAWTRLDRNRQTLETVAERTANCGVRVELDTFPFPNRAYSGTIVPAGRYRALRVVIGPGEGRNWWCVLYPSLCMPGDGETYSILGRWLQSIFGGDPA